MTNLIRTVQNLGIPINHYIEIDMNGFKNLVDAIGGIRLRFDYPSVMFARAWTYPRLNASRSTAYKRDSTYELATLNTLPTARGITTAPRT